MGADDHVAIAVAVDVARRGNGSSEFGARLIALDRPCGRRCKTRGRPKESVDTPLVGLAVVVGEGADDHVREAVAVDITRRGDRGSELGVRLIALGGPGRGGRETGRRAEENRGTPLVGLAVVEERRADDDLVESIPVDVSGRRDRRAELCAGLVALGGPGRSGRETGGRSEEHIGAPFVGLSIVVTWSADDDIAEAVAVDVSPRCDRRAEPCSGLIALEGPGRSRRETGRRSEEQISAPLVGLSVVEQRCADDDVAVAVAVDVSGGRDGRSELSVRLVALRSPGRRGHQRIDRERIHRVPILDSDEKAPSAQIESGGDLGSGCILHKERAVPQDGATRPVAKQDFPSVIAEIGSQISAEGELQGQGAVRIRRLDSALDDESVFEPSLVVRIPFVEPFPAEHDAV